MLLERFVFILIWCGVAGKIVNSSYDLFFMTKIYRSITQFGADADLSFFFLDSFMRLINFFDDDYFKLIINMSFTVPVSTKKYYKNENTVSTSV